MNPHLDPMVTRRDALKTGAGGTLGGVLAAGRPASARRSGGGKPDVYETLGVKRIINAAGTITTLGGSLMPPEVVSAWTQASKSFVNLNELQDRVGRRIAGLLEVEAAMVTTGAAGGIVVGTAAAVTHRDPDRIPLLPLPPGMGIEVIRQKAHRTCYDNQVKACGVKLVDVETRAQLERAIHPRTAMMLSYNFLEADGKIGRKEWLEVARKNRVPTLLDAAADTPPLDALRKYTRMGYDMVVFSGGKAIRGPQDAGLLLGRKDLVKAAKRNTAPRCGTIGRGMKVGKEDMVAMWAAVERYVRMDHEAERRRWERRIGVIEKALKGIPTVTTRTLVPPIANHVPHLLIHWDPDRVRITSAQIKRKLSEGDPSIATARVHGTGKGGFLVSVFMLESGEDEIVGARMRKILRQAALPR